MPRVLTGSITDKRADISLAALLVNVTARISWADARPVWMSQAMRVVKTRVLPLPAPAKTSADWSGRVTAASWGGLSWASRSGIGGIASGTRTSACNGAKADRHSLAVAMARPLYARRVAPALVRAGRTLSA